MSSTSFAYWLFHAITFEQIFFFRKSMGQNPKRPVTIVCYTCKWTLYRGVARGEAEISDQGFVRLARKARGRRAHPRGVWGHAPPETFWISDLLRCNLGAKYSAPHLLRHARNRSSAWRGVLNDYASYFRSGNFEVLYTAINNYTNGVSTRRRARRPARRPAILASGEAVFTMLTVKYQLHPQE